MFLSDREKKMLAQRQGSPSEPEVQSYEDFKRKQDEGSYLDTGIPGEYVDKLASGVSKVGDLLKNTWYEISTPRWKKEEHRKKGM